MFKCVAIKNLVLADNWEYLGGSIHSDVSLVWKVGEPSLRWHRRGSRCPRHRQRWVIARGNPFQPARGSQERGELLQWGPGVLELFKHVWTNIAILVSHAW